MKHLYSIMTLALAMTGAMGLRAQTPTETFTATLTEAGTLAATLGDKALEIESLTVNGPVDFSDFTTMWNGALEGKLRVIDLKGASLPGNKVPDYAFFSPREQLELPVTYLPLRSVSLPEGVTEIGKSAFAYTLIEDFSFPSSLSNLGVSAFDHCINLAGEAIAIPEGVTEIPHQCFQECGELKSISLPSTLTKLGSWSFSHAGLVELDLPEGLEEIEMYALQGTSALESLVMPNTVHSIGEQALGWQFALKELHISESARLTELPPHFMEYSTGIEQLVIPDNIEVIGENAFVICENLRDVHLSASLRTVRASAFAGCAIEVLTLPASLESIGKEAFACPKIKDIYCGAAVPPACEDGDPFRGVSEDTPLYVPVGSARLYKMSQVWRRFRQIVETPELSGITAVDADNPCHGEVEYFNLRGERVENPSAGEVYVRRAGGETVKVVIDR